MKAKALVAILSGASIMAASAAMAEGTREVPAAPAEYLKMKNPVKSNKKSEERGEKLFGRKCKKCHGSHGDGKGSSAEGLNPMPTAFSKKGYLKTRPDGQLFYIIKEGSKGTDMEAFGPGTAANLSEKDIWNIVNYLRDEFQK